MTDIPAIKKPDDIPRLVAHHAQLDMVTVKCFCSRNYLRFVSCFVDAGQRAAPCLAQALNGDVLGHATVSFVLALPPDFNCTQRDEKLLSRDGKCLCRRGYSKANPKLAA